MNRFKNILLLLVLTMVVSTMSASATPQEIKLCQKDQNIGGSWAICDPQTQTEKVHGTFGYEADPADSSHMIYTAAVSNGMIEGMSYTLVYYRDTDPTHVAASTLPLIQLGSGVATVGGALTISGTYVDGDIPAIGDVNPRGKIWIIPTNVIVAGFPTWAHWSDYMYESDMYTPDTDPAGEASTVLTRMGGITFDDGIVNVIAPVTCEGNYVKVLSPQNPTTASGMNDVQFNTLVTPQTNEMLTYTWNVNGESVDSQFVVSGGFSTTFTANTYNVNNGLVDIQKNVLVEVSSSCGQTIAPVNTIWTIQPQIKSISVDVATITFADVAPGNEVSGNDAIVTNTGNVPVDVTVTPSAMSLTGHPDINAPEANPELITGLPVDSDETVGLTLNVPANAYGGTYTGTVEFATS